MKSGKQNEWQRDLYARQRNVVFPDTAANEARFWRNLITGKQKLSVAHIIGLGLMFLTLAGALYAVVSIQLEISGAEGPLWKRVLSSFGMRILLLVVGVAILVGGQIVSRRAKGGRPRQDS
jgi:predicted phage tail protein